MGQVTIRLKDKENGMESKEVPIEELIFYQHEIEFEFGEFGNENYGTLPYKDFLFFRDDYEVIVHIKEEGNSNEKSN